MKALAPTLIASVALIAFLIGRSMHASTVSAPRDNASEKQSPSALLKSNAADFKADWLHTIGTADRDSALTAVEWQKLLSSARLDPDLSARVVARWAKQDPLACWEHLLTLSGGTLPPDHLAMAAIEAYAVAEPERAMQELSEANAPLRKELRGELMWKALRAILVVDLEKGMSLAPLAHSSSFSWGGTEPWMIEDPAKACRLLDTLPPNHTFRHTIGQAALAWFDVDEGAAIAWATTLPRSSQSEALKQIAGRMQEKGDLDGIRQLALSAESMRIRRSIARPYLRSLLKEDPIAACDWVAEHFDGQTLGQAMAETLRQIDSDALPPAQQVPYVEQIPDGSDKGQAVSALITSWFEMDGSAAANWLSTLSQDTVERSNRHSKVREWVVLAEGRRWIEDAEASPFRQQALLALERADREAAENNTPN